MGQHQPSGNHFCQSGVRIGEAIRERAVKRVMIAADAEMSGEQAFRGGDGGFGRRSGSGTR